MLKRFISMIIALTFTLSFVITTASCTKDAEIPEEYLESLTDSEESKSENEIASDDEGTEKDVDKFETIFEYLESVKNVSAVKVFELEDTVTTLKTLIQFAYKSGLVTREAVADMVISQANIEGIDSLKGLLDKVEEECPYATLVESWENAVSEVEEPIMITLEELNKYESYEELILAQKDTLVNETTAVADIVYAVLSANGLDAVKAYLEATDSEYADLISILIAMDRSEEDNKMLSELFYGIIINTIQESIETELTNSIEEVGMDKINEFARQALGETFENKEELFDYIDSLLLEAKPYIVEGINYAITHDVSDVIAHLTEADFDPKSVPAIAVDIVSDDEIYKAIAHCAESVLPYAELKAKVEEEAMNVAYLELISFILEAFEGEGNGYYNILDAICEFNTPVLDKATTDKFVEFFEYIETVTVGDVMNLITPNKEIEG